MPMTAAKEAAYRAGLEDAARVAERGRLVPDCYDQGRSTVVVDMAADEIAAAIRALPVPESSEPTAADWAERYRLVCFELCERMGIKPDEIIADSGEEAWMLAGYEATTKQTAAALRAARGQG